MMIHINARGINPYQVVHANASTYITNNITLKKTLISSILDLRLYHIHLFIATFNLNAIVIARGRSWHHYSTEMFIRRIR